MVNLPGFCSIAASVASERFFAARKLHHAEGAVLKIWYDAGPAVVVDHLPDRSLAVFQQSHVFGQRDHPALKENFARERLFKMCSIHRFVPVLPCAVQRMIL